MNYAQSMKRDGTPCSFDCFFVLSSLLKEYPELELAVGSFPYSSLAPPTTDERAAVTDSISIATAGFKENFLNANPLES